MRRRNCDIDPVRDFGGRVAMQWVLAERVETLQLDGALVGGAADMVEERKG